MTDKYIHWTAYVDGKRRHVIAPRPVTREEAEASLVTRFGMEKVGEIVPATENHRSENKQ